MNLKAMVFGDKNEFAIEAYHEPSGPSFGGFGRMCIHIQNQRFGKIDEPHCSLFNSVDRFRELQAELENLWDERFTGHSDSQIFDLLDSLLYKNSGQSLEAMQADWNHFRRFNFLTNEGEQFDDFKSFIVKRPDSFAHVLFEFRDNMRGSVSFSLESFQHVTKLFLEWFDVQIKNVAPPFFPVE